MLIPGIILFAIGIILLAVKGTLPAGAQQAAYIVGLILVVIGAILIVLGALAMAGIVLYLTMGSLPVLPI